MIKNWALYCLAIFSLSQASILIRWAHAPPEVIGFWRLLSASILLVPFAVFSKKNAEYSLLKNYGDLRWIGLTSIFFFAHLYTYFYAAEHTRISNCMILFSLNPLFVALGARMVFKEHFGIKLLVGYFFGMASIIILALSKIESGPESNWSFGFASGEWSALFSGIFFSAYILSGKKIREKVPNLPFSMILYFLTSLLFLVFGAIQSTPFLGYPTHTWMGIAGTVILPTLLGHALFSSLYGKLKINAMACGKLFEPALSSVSAFLVFHENLSKAHLFAFAFSSFSIVTLFLKYPKFLDARRNLKN